MANRRQPLIPHWLWPGLLAAGLILAVAALAMGSLWRHAPESDWRGLWQDSYLWHVVRFTFWQALLSALISVLPAIALARALYRRRFPGRLLLLRLCAMTLVLPVLVAVFGLLSVYGRQGWLASLCGWLGINYSFSPMVCRASCWRICSSICRWPPACCCRRWKTFRSNSANWRLSSA